MECEREIFLGIRNSYWIANGKEEVTGWHSTLYLVYAPFGCLLGHSNSTLSKSGPNLSTFHKKRSQEFKNTFNIITVSARQANPSNAKSE